MVSNKKDFLEDVAYALGHTIFNHALDFLITALVMKPLSKAIVTRATPDKHNGAGRLASARWFTKISPDGAILDGPAPAKAYAKFAIRKGLPLEENGKVMAIENAPHLVDDFNGEIKDGYGKGFKKLVYSGRAIIKVGERRHIGKINIHQHNAEKAGLHFDFVAEGVEPGTKQFEAKIDDGTYKGRYAVVRPDKFDQGKGQVLITRMKDRGVVLAKPSFNLKSVDFLKELEAHPEDAIVEWKPDGCFTGQAQILCYNGSVIRMKDIIAGANPVLAGIDEWGNVVPSHITNRMDNGKKKNWLAVGFSCPSVPRGSKRAKKRLMIVTDNHHVLHDDKYVPISSLSVGSTVSTVEYQPPLYLLEIMEAGLLGDGSICRNGSSYNYQEGHTYKHLEYVMEMRGWFGNCGVMVSDTTSGFGSKMCWVQSRAYKILGDLRQHWYPNGTKKVPDDLSWITHRVVAKWFMDDGSRKHSINQKDRAEFATNGFIQSDVQRLANKLHEMYEVDCSVEFNKGWMIRVNATSERTHKNKKSSGEGAIDNFWKAIAPFITPIMRYKLPEEYKDVEYEGLPSAQEELIKVGAIITSVTSLGSRNPRQAFDIETTTHNYICHGIVVHNSLANVLIHDGKAIFRSHRDTGETYYDKLPALESLANHSPLMSSRLLFPSPDLDGTVIRGELFHPEGAARVGGILNSGSVKAIEYQSKHGPVVFYAWDEVQHKGKDISGLPYQQRRDILESDIGTIRRFNPNWHVVPRATSSFSGFYNRIITDPRGLPWSEGVVVKRGSESSGSPWYKVKHRDTVDVRVVSIQEGTGKREGSVGQMVVETESGARSEVGSFQVNDEQLKWMWNNRDILEGQVAEIHVQEITKSGAVRAGVFYRWHPSKSDVGLLMYALDDRSSLFAMKSAVGWRKK